MTGYIFTWNEREFMKRNRKSGITKEEVLPCGTKLKVWLDDGGRFILSQSFLDCHEHLNYDTDCVYVKNTSEVFRGKKV